MSRWWLQTLVVVLCAIRPASAQTFASPSVTTDRAAIAVRDATTRIAQLIAQRAQLQKLYRTELDAIDRLKKQRVSWRRDRELRESLSSSLDTANQLSGVAREIDRMAGQVVAAQRAYVRAIDTELAEPARLLPARIQALHAARAPLIVLLRGAPRRIVLPDLDIDPLADPEELDQRAIELRASEAELQRELAGLDAHAAALERAESPPSSSAGVEPYLPAILSEVVDASTVASLAAAQRSTDPAQRARATRKARAAVAARLDEVRHKRAEIEARARQLRAP